jgi:excisionase family DNA binding protein
MTLLDSKQISEYLAVKPGTIRAWTCAGVIPSVKLGPGEKGVVRYPKEEIDKWVKSCLRRERRITKRQNARPLVSETEGH